ncbi:MAG: hypothetical protein JJE35_00960 [Thermoleophilia bacterium]|nr:hypothetical protein [Thermoleophilia bacterium]
MPEDQITLNLSRADAEILLGVLASERHNAEAEEACSTIRRQLDEELAKSQPGGG